MGVVEGDALLGYSFPPPHPFGAERARAFWRALEALRLGEVRIEPERADDRIVGLFHDQEHIELVRRASDLGRGYLDEGDTPAFEGVLEAAEFVVGSTVSCVERVLAREVEHAFSPVGGLHHARRDRSAGFCVFNDVGVAVELLRKKGVRRVLYVDIDVHHGDGVFYPFEADPDLFVFDVHEDGRLLYPGTGRPDETGRGEAAGTKANVVLAPGEGDERLRDVIPALEGFAAKCRPEFVILQCGADGLAGDPLGGLAYSPEFHRSVAQTLHLFSHRVCSGRLVALGGGGYDPANCASAWTAVVRNLVEKSKV